MAIKKIGSGTIRFTLPPAVAGYASVAGKKEGEGPLANTFDYLNEDTTFGEKTWEKSESRMQQEAINRACDKAGLVPGMLDCLIAGDLINQCTSSSFGLRDYGVPLIGIFGACSTMAEGIGLAASMIDGGYMNNAAAVTSSHFCTAERQFRSPLEYGAQRPPTAQWTVTGSGAVILSENGAGPFITHYTIGKIVDLGIKDANNMGAAMAPADDIIVQTGLQRRISDTDEPADLIPLNRQRVYIRWMTADGIRNLRVNIQAAVIPSSK
jgi:stage V sporulation protein AD